MAEFHANNKVGSEHRQKPKTQDTAFFLESIISHSRGKRTQVAKRLSKIMKLKPKTILMIANGGYVGKKTKAKIYKLYQEIVVGKVKKPSIKRVVITFPGQDDLAAQIKEHLTTEEMRDVLSKAVKNKTKWWRIT